MTDRGTFAAAALTGLLAQGDDGSFSEESYARAAYRWADAMLRERERTSVGVAGMDPVADRKSVATPGACARPCSQPFDSAPTTDQERFNAAVINWISEASMVLFHHMEQTTGGQKIISDACDRCWSAYGRHTTNHDAAPEARAQVDAAGISRQGTGDTPVTDPMPKEKRAEVSYTLTDAEREAIVQAIGLADWHKAYFSHLKQGEPLPSATLRGLLERAK